METDEFWEMYWDARLQALQNQGKREAIRAISKTMRRLSRSLGRSLRLLELGCGEGQIIGALAEGHSQIVTPSGCVGVDYLPSSLQTARHDYPSLNFIEGNFTDPKLISGLGQFDIVMMVNSLHEVFSSAYSAVLGEVDVKPARRLVEQTFALAVTCVSPGGYLALFDGLEPPVDLRQKVRLRFLTREAFENFQSFASEYHPFQISYRVIGDSQRVELSQRDFTRYITKSIFLGKKLWKTERLESYQYFTEADFRALFASSGLEILEIRTLTMNEEKWRRTVRIESPGVRFPEEHILIMARKPADTIKG